MAKKMDNTKILVGVIAVLLAISAFLYSMPLPSAEIDTVETQRTFTAADINSGVSTNAVIEGTVPVGGSTMTTAEVL